MPVINQTIVHRFCYAHNTMHVCVHTRSNSITTVLTYTVLCNTCAFMSSISSSLIVALFLASLFALKAAIFSTDIFSLSGLIWSVIAPPFLLAPSLTAKRCFVKKTVNHQIKALDNTHFINLDIITLCE